MSTRLTNPPRMSRFGAARIALVFRKPLHTCGKKTNTRLPSTSVAAGRVNLAGSGEKCETPPTAGNFQQMALLSALPIESNASHHSTKAFVIPFTPIKPAFRCVSRAADRKGEKGRCANLRAGELRKNGPTPTFDLPLHFVPKSCLHKCAIYVNPKGILKLTRQCDKLFFRKPVLCPSSGRRFEGRKSPPHRASLNPTRW